MLMLLISLINTLRYAATYYYVVAFMLADAIDIVADMPLYTLLMLLLIHTPCQRTRAICY